MKVLVIDDEPDVLDLLVRQLQAAGHEVQSTLSARTGLQLLETEPFDALVTDILIPDFDGIELMLSIRRRLPDLWVVAISGGGHHLSASDTLRMTDALGANRHLMKPFSADELLAVLQERPQSATARSAIDAVSAKAAGA